MRNDVNAESQKSENSEKWQLAKWEQFLLPLQQNGKSTPVDRPVQQVKMSVNQENGRGKKRKRNNKSLDHQVSLKVCNRLKV